MNIRISINDFNKIKYNIIRLSYKRKNKNKNKKKNNVVVIN
ncbi:hypothetical protein [Candidatus Purcelliella pentastirinorum]|nr:hypothetical protein [Candidatus Purcelliella pentastirinorum]